MLKMKSFHVFYSKYSSICHCLLKKLSILKLSRQYMSTTFRKCTTTQSPESFSLKKVLLLTKLSRFEFEKRTHPELTERELEKSLRKRGSDYNLLLYHHYIHKGIENTVHSVLSGNNIEIRTVSRFDYTDENIEWADAIFTTGGDGTFLLAASRILDNRKPVIGFNSDPTRSKGHLCLPQKYSVDVKEAIHKIINGKFRWKFRSRIRVTMFGQNIFDPPVELHSQELKHPEYRYLDIDPQLRTAKKFQYAEENESKTESRVIPVLALNEVFIGECVSARVSYMELSFDGEPHIKQKCSGLIVSTGTGSTSWTYNINKLTEQNMEDILTIVKEESGLPIRDTDERFVQKVTNTFNELLIIDPEASKMVYTIRDPLLISPLKNPTLKPRGFSRDIDIKSRCFDASLVIDGSMSFRFNDGTKASLQMLQEDALRTVAILEDQHHITYKH